MANRTIEIIVEVNDQTSGKLKGAQRALIEMDKTAQRLANRFKSFSTSNYMATIRLIDRVTEPGNRINNLLRRLAGSAWRVSLHLADGALGKLRQVESLLMRITSRAYNIAVNVKDNLKGKFGGLLNGAAMGAGMLMPLGGAMGVGFGVANGIQAYAGFEQQMSRVQAIRQLSKDSTEMQALTQLAKDLGMQTAWTRQQVGQAMEYQALAGWSTNQILQSTPHLLNLASAGGLDLGRTSDIVTDAMTAFGLRAEETYTNKQGREVNAVEHFADMLAKMQAISNTDISQAGEAFKYSANVIGAMFSGQDISKRMQATEDAMIMTGLMANAGIKGSMAGTATRAIFSRITSENRNAFRALGAMGVEFKDEGGNILMPGEIMRNLSRRFKEGIDPNQLLTFAEEMQGEKIHADTRRKLESFIEQTAKNGGKMGSADMAKMSAMLAGQEAMSGLLAVLMGDWDAMAEKMDNVNGTAKEMAETMLDNLAGSFTKLGSAWDAFQQGFMEGSAGEGLRAFVDSLTELVTRANKLFSDGIQIGDFGKIIGDIIGRLKNKFLELDGIGSVLAGGALAAGLMKIITLIQKGTAALKAMTSAAIATGTSTALSNVAGGAAAISTAGRTATATGAAAGLPAIVTTMSRASGDIAKAAQRTRLLSDKALASAWGAPGSASAQAAYRTADLRATRLEGYVQRQAIKARVEAYNEEIASQKQALALAREQSQAARAARFANMRGAAMGGAAFAGIFGALDIMNLKAMNAERLAGAAPEERAQIIRENRQAEWEAGAGVTGSVIGAALGSALGSFAGPIGTAIGGIVGGMIGQVLGVEVGKTGAENERNNSSNVDVSQISEHVPGHQPKDYSFGQTAASIDSANFKDYAELPKAPTAQTTTQAGTQTTQQTETTEDYLKNLNDELGKDTQQWIDDFKRNNVRDFGATWQGNATDYGSYSHGESNDDLISFDGVGERIGEVGTQIANGLSSALESARETLRGFGSMISEDLSASMEAAGEFMSNLGSSITDGLASAMAGAGEIFAGLSDSISAGLEAAGSMATGALESIQSAFSSAKDTIQSAWGELPGFFEGVFSGLGGAAQAAGSAIYSGLTSVIGSVIGAWENASATIGGIISQIGSMASSAGAGVSGAVSSVIARVRGHAEGGFVTSPELSWLGERGAELVLPLTDRERSLELLGQASGMLGLDNGLPSDSVVSQGNSASESFDVGGVTINASFTINGGEDVMQTIQENLESLADKVAAKFAVNIKDCYRNRALA